MASAGGVAGPSLTAGTARSFIGVRLAAGLPVRWPYHVLIIRTLAWLTRSRGAGRASDHRREAAPGHIQPLSLRRNGTSGHAWRRQAVFRECPLSSRSRVRVAVGAQLSVRIPAPFPPLGSQTGSKPIEIRPCGGQGTSHLATGRLATIRQILRRASDRRLACVPDADRGPVT